MSNVNMPESDLDPNPAPVDADELPTLEQLPLIEAEIPWRRPLDSEAFC